MSFKSFLISKKRTIIFYFLSGLILILSFILYNLPLKAVIYPLILCFILGFIFVLTSYVRVKELHDVLKGIEENNVVSLEDLPKANTDIEEDYQRIIKLLDENERALLGQKSQKYNDMVEYYTMWAHQIKTPIASMKLSLQNDDSEFSRKLQNDLTRIERYVEMVLAFLRLDSKSTDYVFKNISLDDVIKQAVRSFSSEFILKGLKLEYDELGKTVLSDEKWLSFVIEQILSNALKYTNEGSIKIFFEDPDTLCIKDTGIGIASEDLPRVFENGYTGFNGRTNKKASGIGLYLCKRVCDNLGHKISIDSLVGSWTIVRISFGNREVEIE